MHGTSRQESEGKNLPRPIPYGVLCFLIFVSLGALVFGVFYITQNIREPFSLKGGASQASSLPSLDTQETSKEALKTVDTDGDGLSDYDELYVYHTSPYLKDTDSDGYDDKTEIMTGHDPNCPEGKNCFGAPLSSTSTVYNASSTPATGVGLEGIFGSNAPSSLEQLGNLSVDQIKKLLMSQGIKAEDLAKIDDATLKQMYQKTYQDFVTKYQNGNDLPSSPSPSSLQSLPFDQNKLQHPETLTPAEIREFLRRSGSVSEEQLKSIDDTRLKDAFIQSVKKVQAKQ